MGISQHQSIGLLVPVGANALVEDLGRLLPRDVALKVGRLYKDSKRNARDRLFDMGTHIERKVEEMVVKSPDVIVFGCTGGSFIGGLGYDQDIAQRIRSVSDLETVIAATAAVDALNHIGAKSISVCSPYSGEWEFENEALYHFYKDNGFQIQSIEATTVGESLNKKSAMQLALRVDRPEADAVFISCTDFVGALDVVDQLEDVLAKPVITVNQAILWDSMRKLGRSRSYPQGGILLREGLNKTT